MLSSPHAFLSFILHPPFRAALSNADLYQANLLVNTAVYLHHNSMRRSQLLKYNSVYVSVYLYLQKM